MIKKIFKKKIVYMTVAFIIVLGAICFGYLLNGYKADQESIVAFSSGGYVSKSIDKDNNTYFYGHEIKAGIIFYPGGKVESISYEPLLRSLAERGILCVLCDMPFDLAVFDIDAADGIAENYPDTEKWYMAGHSLGGAMAASYIADNTDNFDGLILLGAYSTEDLSTSDLDILSIYGSEDKVLNKDKYDNNLSNLPFDYTEVVIEGGNHAYFGMYGEQDGDGKAIITNVEQIMITAESIADFIFQEE